jgi:hypothetical protein
MNLPHWQRQWYALEYDKLNVLADLPSMYTVVANKVWDMPFHCAISSATVKNYYFIILNNKLFKILYL